MGDVVKPPTRARWYEVTSIRKGKLVVYLGLSSNGVAAGSAILPVDLPIATR